MRRRPRPWLLLAGLLAAAGALASGQEDIPRLRECSYCGMDRKAYGFARALVQYQDGSEVGTCSLHCAVTELDAHPEKRLKALLVADRNTHQLIESTSANWVMGGRKRAVMAARPKWAFSTPEAATAFIRESGGELVSWPQALAAAREDVAREARTKATRAPPRAFGCASPAA